MRTGCAARAAAPPTDAVCATAAEHRRPPAAHHGPRSVRPQVHRQPGLRNLLLDGGWQQPEGWSQVRTSSAVAVSSQLRVCAAAAPRFRCRCCVCARRTTCGLAGDWRARCPRTHSAPFEPEIKPVNVFTCRDVARWTTPTADSRPFVSGAQSASRFRQLIAGYSAAATSSVKVFLNTAAHEEITLRLPPTAACRTLLCS